MKKSRIEIVESSGKYYYRVIKGKSILAASVAYKSKRACLRGLVELRELLKVVV